MVCLPNSSSVMLARNAGIQSRSGGLLYHGLPARQFECDACKECWDKSRSGCLLYHGLPAKQFECDACKECWDKSRSGCLLYHGLPARQFECDACKECWDKSRSGCLLYHGLPAKQFECDACKECWDTVSLLEVYCIMVCLPNSSSVTLARNAGIHSRSWRYVSMSSSSVEEKSVLSSCMTPPWPCYKTKRKTMFTDLLTIDISDQYCRSSLFNNKLSHIPNPSNAEATFVQCTRTQRFLKTILTMSCWYSSDSSHWVLSAQMSTDMPQF